MKIGIPSQLAAIAWAMAALAPPSGAQALEGKLRGLVQARLEQDRLEQDRGDPAGADRDRARPEAADASAPQARSAMPGIRYEVEVGKIDERLRLAPCERIEPLWPANARAWGPLHVALRCVQGPVHWKVFIPVRVRAFAIAPVLAAPLPMGSVVEERHLKNAEIDFSASPQMPITDRAAIVGRSLSRSLSAGQSLLPTDFRMRQWFASGEPVRVLVNGPGYSLTAEGQAVTAGIEGQTSRVRLDSGRILNGRAVAERQLEVGP